MGIQDKSMSYTCEKYNKTHEFIQLIHGNKKEKYSNLSGENNQSKGYQPEELDWVISYGGFIR